MKLPFLANNSEVFADPLFASETLHTAFVFEFEKQDLLRSPCAFPSRSAMFDKWSRVSSVSTNADNCISSGVACSYFDILWESRDGWKVIASAKLVAWLHKRFADAETRLTNSRRRKKNLFRASYAYLWRRVSFLSSYSFWINRQTLYRTTKYSPDEVFEVEFWTCVFI